MRIAEVEIGQEYVVRYTGDRVRAEAIEKVATQTVPVWGRGYNRNVRKVKVTWLNLVTGKPRTNNSGATQVGHLEARELAGLWAPYAEAQAAKKKAQAERTAAAARLREAFGDMVMKDQIDVVTSFGGTGVTAYLTVEAAEWLAEWIELH
jgi:hypothetical protein